MKITNKTTVVALSLGVTLGAGLVLSTQWFNRNYIIQSPVKIQFQSIIRNRPSPATIENKAVKPSKAIPTPSQAQKQSFLIESAYAQEKGITTGPESYIVDKIMTTFGKNGEVAVAVARAESGLRYNAQNSCCAGIFQIHRVHKAKYEGEDIYDVDTNIRVAYEIFKAQGWQPWEAYTNGAYKKFL